MRRRKERTPRPARCHPGRKALAYHEAGHAVAGYALGLEIERLTIVPTERYLGHCFYRAWEDAETTLDLDARLLLLLAAPAAEERATGTPSFAADEQQALRLVLARGPGGENEAGHVAACRRAAARFIDDHWPAVHLLARALRKHRDLDGPQAMALLARAFRARRGLLSARSSR